jgi:hypothetical protein
MMRTVAWVAIPFMAAAVGAQSAPSTQCPSVNGITASTSLSDSADAVRDTNRLRLDSRTTIDTTWTFDVRERTWNWPSFAASVGIGFNGGSMSGRAGGTTTAPDSAAARAWSICAAASVGMRNSTLTLRGARGTVHLRADVSALTGAGRTTRDTASRPRR